MHILIVDDNKDIVNLIKIVLSFENITSSSAINGLEAIDACNKTKFDLILLDLMMDKMDGLTAASHLKKSGLNINTPLIALTAKAFEKDKIMVLKKGFTDHLTKPFRTEELLNCIRKNLSLTKR